MAFDAIQSPLVGCSDLHQVANEIGVASEDAVVLFEKLIVFFEKSIVFLDELIVLFEDPVVCAERLIVFFCRLRQALHIRREQLQTLR